ncbi:MAG: hypothetical protein ACNI25_13460 [Halarcobacter sp.]
MSITDIKLTEKEKVFIRLIQNNENIFDACSKAGITISSKVLNALKTHINCK